ncbi:aldose 1-epimerase family protein [Flavihumibacter fluvii]|uniref:aldose 1-epimerase family protein n=1 Tax=Flavihumibacter fluvii TaxID=2838157 RepID=UPI001BDF6397|nr:aldose 1-epimerase family protein [Flavihumibacter fluvii]ULQ52364.1 aldose 1-epimerase family protein [Flavihumibacter fluvii]
MAELITLDNGVLEVKIHPKGAELRVLRNKATGINYMWSGDANFWGKYSPILFPIVGQLRDNTYLYNGNSYSLPRHGFARDRTFQVEQTSDHSAVFTLQDDAESHAVYPFAFVLQVFYELDNHQLTTRYTVTNPGTGELLFSIGAHPAFAVPLLIDGVESAYEDYSLVFNHSAALTRWKLDNGLLTSNHEPVILQDHVLPLRKELFAEDAVVLKGLADNTIRLACSKHSHGIDFSWTDFPFFGIWAAPGAPFVCLEPWCGIADHVHHDLQLTTKEGIQSLPPGETWTRQWQVNCF